MSEPDLKLCPLCGNALLTYSERAINVCTECVRSKKYDLVSIPRPAYNAHKDEPKEGPDHGE